MPTVWIRNPREAADKSDRRRRWWWIAALALVVPIQGALASVAAIGDAAPDLPLVVVALFALGQRRVTSVAAGAAVGALVDVLSAGAGSFHLVTYAALAFCAASVGRVTANVRLATAVSVVAACSVALGIAYSVTGPPVERADDMIRWWGWTLAPQVAYNTAIGAGLFAVRTWRRPPAQRVGGERDDLFSSGRFQGLIR
ncbi:MAG: hypothetical protein ACOYXR_12055 [Nitrospirota bacterium]